MDNRTKKTGRFRRLLFGLMGGALSKVVIHRMLRKKIDKSPTALPADLSRCSEILFILPSDKMEMIFQLENLFTILGRYKNSSATFICPAAYSSFVNGLKNVRVMKFNPAEFSLYSEEFNKLVKELTVKSFDICVMLERQCTLAHLYLAGLSRAHLRIGWEAERCYPFLNIRLIPVKREGATLWERNLEAAKILDADVESRVRWGVQKSTAEEIAQLLSEHKLRKDPALICIDLASLEGNCGKEWCAELMKSLKNAPKMGQFYVFGGTEDEVSVVGDAPFPVLPKMSLSRAAALIASTDLIVAGFGPLFGLAQISSRSKLVPVMTSEQAEFYCKRNERIMPVVFPQTPGADEVRAVQKNLKALMAVSVAAAGDGDGEGSGTGAGTGAAKEAKGGQRADAETLVLQNRGQGQGQNQNRNQSQSQSQSQSQKS